MTIDTAVRTYQVPAQLTRQMNELEKFMDSPGYMGSATHTLTLDCKAEILIGKGDEAVTFPVGSTLSRMQAERICILQHTLVGRITFKWDDHPGVGTFELPGR